MTNHNIPPWAKAVIIAELEQDESDIQTDYHGSTTVKTVVLGFSKHQRDLFPEMRKHAAQFPETAHLGPGMGIWKVWDYWTNEHGYEESQLFCGKEHQLWFPTQEEAQAYADLHIREDEAQHQKLAAGEINSFCPHIRGELRVKGSVKAIEHREKWSMGHGYYLGHDRHSGWQVRKCPLSNYYLKRIPALIEQGHHNLDSTQDSPNNADIEPVSSITVQLNKAKNGIEISFPKKPSLEIRTALKLHGFIFHRKKIIWYAKQSPERLAFAQQLQV